MFQIENLYCSYGKTPVLENIEFHLAEGELCGLFGPNGSGKTTLFKCCLKFIHPTGGCIRFRNRDILTMSAREMAQKVAYVPQNHHPPFPYSVEEMVLMGRTPHMNRFYMPGRRDNKRVERAMELIGITHLAREPYDILSGGQQQMVLIARAIAQDTEVIFLDEPTSALDFKNQVTIWKILRKIVDQGLTVLACSHDPNHVLWFCDTAVVLNGNGIEAQGPPAQIISQELMDTIYHNTCRVKDMDGFRMVVPSGVVREQTEFCFP